MSSSLFLSLYSLSFVEPVIDPLAPFVPARALRFFTSAMCTVIGQILAPVKQLQANSRYFSGVAPTRITGPLPHFTIQMPVYKVLSDSPTLCEPIILRANLRLFVVPLFARRLQEGFESVLKPTIRSVQRAMQTYELQGGSASLLICDDGMQLLSPEELEIRKVSRVASRVTRAPADCISHDLCLTCRSTTTSTPSPTSPDLLTLPSSSGLVVSRR